MSFYGVFRNGIAFYHRRLSYKVGTFQKQSRTHRKKVQSSIDIGSDSQAVFTFVRELEPQEREVITSMTANVKEYAAALSSDDLIEVQNETSTLSIDPETGEVLSETQQTPND